MGAATNGETEITIGQTGQAAVCSVTVGASYTNAGDYTLAALASDLTSTTRTDTTAGAGESILTQQMCKLY